MKIRSISLLLCMVSVFFILPEDVTAQQMVVDDADVSDSHVFESWAGTHESAIQPGFAVNRVWNLNPGIIFDTSTQQFNSANWVIESKIVPVGWSGEQWAFGNVSGVAFDLEGRLAEAYTYFPLSKTFLTNNLFLHLNVGIETYTEDYDKWEKQLFVGFRTDMQLSRRVALLSEVYTTEIKSLGFQAGLQYIFSPERMQMELTYGQSFDGKISYPGLTVGISIEL